MVFRVLPEFVNNLIILSNKLPILTKSSSFIPLVVKAAVPNLIPPGFNGDVSPNTEFLFILISTYSHIFSILLPVIPLSLV